MRSRYRNCFRYGKRRIRNQYKNVNRPAWEICLLCSFVLPAGRPMPNLLLSTTTTRIASSKNTKFWPISVLTNNIPPVDCRVDGATFGRSTFRKSTETRTRLARIFLLSPGVLVFYVYIPFLNRPTSLTRCLPAPQFAVLGIASLINRVNYAKVFCE